MRGKARILRRLLHLDDRLDCALEHLARVEGKVDTIMTLATDITAKLAEIDAATTADGVVLADLFNRLKGGTLSDAEKADVFAHADAVVAHLKAIAVDPNAPVPPAPPPLPQTKKKP